MSGTEVTALLAAVMTPILGGYSVLFIALRSQFEGRIKDRDAEIARLLQERDGEIKRLVAERDTNAALLRQERDRAQQMAWQALTAADRSVQTTALALELNAANPQGQQQRG